MADESKSNDVGFRVGLAEAEGEAFNKIVVYDWFTRGEDRAPPRAGNAVEILVDGEQTWQRVADDLDTARDEVQVATWMCRPDIELTRPEDLAMERPHERADRRFGELVERLAQRGTKIRLLLWGMAYTPITEKWMRRWFWRGKDNIDVVEQDHPSLIGSYHQKTMAIDGRVGYCGGMNLKENDWDTIEHHMFDVRRFPHTADAGRRRETQQRLAPPPFAPRHDLTVRVEGPAVGDLLQNFHDRWSESIEARKRSAVDGAVDRLRSWLGTETEPKLDPPGERPEVQGETLVQIVRTTPEGEDGILGAYFRAIYNARRYIYIENQYFRSPRIGQALAQVLQANPRLRLAVVVRPVAGGEKSRLDPSGYWTAHTMKEIQKARPDFKLTQLLIHEHDAYGELQTLEVDVHAKVMVIDDVWVTVGSANINDRGFKTEGEINAVILDKPLAKDLRLRLMGEHLGRSPNDEAIQSVDDAFDMWEAHGDENPERLASGEVPKSRIHHFIQDAPDKPPFGIGRGVF